LVNIESYQGFEGFERWFGQYGFRILIVFLFFSFFLSGFFDRNDVVFSFFLVNFFVAFLGVVLIIWSGDVFFFRNGMYRMGDRGWLLFTSYFNPNSLSRFLLCGLPFAILYSFRKNFVLAAFLFLLNMIVLYSASSRMAMLSLFMSMLVLFFVLDIKKINKIFLFLAFFLLIGVFFETTYERFQEKYDQIKDNGTSIRIAMLEATIKAVNERPLLGYGPGNAKAVINSDSEFIEVYELFFPGSEHQIALHNTSMLIAIDLGVLGVFIYNFIFVFIGFYLFRLFILSSDFLYLAVFFSLMFVAFMGFTSVIVGENITWIVLGFSLCCIKFRSRENFHAL
jgi:O-antigen ligase